MESKKEKEIKCKVYFSCPMAINYFLLTDNYNGLALKRCFGLSPLLFRIIRWPKTLPEN